jgi:hypothetical protein
MEAEQFILVCSGPAGRADDPAIAAGYHLPMRHSCPIQD